MFCLPKRYRSQTPIDFDDTAPTAGPGSWEWQPDVIPFALALAAELGASRLVDVGCGSGRKLEGIDFLDVVGYDRAEIVDKLTPQGWEARPIDLEVVSELPDVAGAVVVCSDVIEHMHNPTPLVATLRSALARGALAVVVSTPDREATRGRRHMGPPPNRHHAREWSLAELVAFLIEEGLVVLSAERTRSNDHEPALATSLVVCA